MLLDKEQVASLTFLLIFIIVICLSISFNLFDFKVFLLTYLIFGISYASFLCFELITNDGLKETTDIFIVLILFWIITALYIFFKSIRDYVDFYRDEVLNRISKKSVTYSEHELIKALSVILNSDQVDLEFKTQILNSLKKKNKRLYLKLLRT